jgi:hypothetical protein
MKISINSKLQENVPGGGGNQFASYFRAYLERIGVKVVNDLHDSDINVIFHITPFPFLMKASSYSFLDAYLYKLKKPDTVIVHRVNECDERKGTHYMNKLLVKVSKYSEAMVFIASWLKPLMEKSGMDLSKPNKVILQGADNEIFNTIGKEFWDKKRKLKIVTHHWSDNYFKGHDFYHRLDALLANPEFGDKFEFTYIGNYPKSLVYKNTKLIRPLAGKELAEELKKNDVYLTASRNEPAGMHHVEGALCGLPILYFDSGALKEYCGDYGIEFNENNFEDKLREMYDNYELYRQKINNYHRTSEETSKEYYDFVVEVWEKLKTADRNRNVLKICLFEVYNVIYKAVWWVRNKTVIIKNKLTKF